MDDEHRRVRAFQNVHALADSALPVELKRITAIPDSEPADILAEDGIENLETVRSRDAHDSGGHLNGGISIDQSALIDERVRHR